MNLLHPQITIYHYFSIHLNPEEALLLLSFGLVLIFFGSKLWRILTVLIGAVFGYIFYMGYIYKFIPQSYSVIAIMITIIISAIMAGFVARIALSILLSLTVFYIISIFSNTLVGVIAFIISFIIFYILYKKIIIFISTVIGSWMIFTALLALGADVLISSIVSFILLIIGLIYQLRKNKEVKEDDRKVERI